MSIDLTKWQKIGAGNPIPQLKDLKNGEVLSVAEGVETFLVQFTDLKPDTPDYLYRSRLVLRPQYRAGPGFSDIEARDIWLKPSPDPKEITIPYPRSFLIEGIIFRTFEFRRWNRYNRLGRNHDGAWKFELYKSLTEDPSQGLPPTPTPPSTPEWVWIPPQFP